MLCHTDPILFFRILAAQVSEVRSTFDQSTQSLVASLDRLASQAAAAAAANPGIAELNDALADLAFAQAQESDLLSQMMRGISAALARLPADTSIEDLSDDYISDRQRRVHASVLEHSNRDD